MSVLDRKLGRDLLAAKGLLAAIVGIISLGTACFVALLSAYNNLERSRRGYYAQCRMADFSVELKKAPVAAIASLDRIAGISAYRPRITFEVTIDLDGVTRTISGKVLSLPGEREPVINDLVLRQGTYFTGRRREEVIVSDAFARKRGLGPGDRIRVLLNNRRQDLFIVGTAISSEFVYQIGPGSLIPEPENYAILYLEQRFAEEVLDFESACNQVVGLLDPSVRARPDDVLRRIERQLDPYGVFSTTDRDQQPSHKFLASELQGLRTTATFLPTIFLAVAALMLHVMMTRLVEQQRTVIGTLKALGYGNASLFGHFLKFGLTVGLIGGVLGGALGYALAGGLTRVYRDFYEFPTLVNRVYPEVSLTGLGISLGFGVLGTLRGVGVVLRLRPAAAMRPKPPARGRRIGLERWRGLWDLLGFRWHMALRAMFRSRMRTGAGVFASAAGAALMVTTFFSKDATEHMLDFQFEKVLRADFDLAFQEDRDRGALLECRRLPGVDHAEPLLQVACTLENGRRRRKVAVTGLIPEARLTVPRDAQGRQVAIPGVGLMLSRRLAEIVDVEQGESVTLTPVRGLRRPATVPVTKVVDSYFGVTAYADYEYLNHLVGTANAHSRRTGIAR